MTKLTDNHLQESFYSKLKTFADDDNTNLYVSNLPKTMNEHVRPTSNASKMVQADNVQELASLFAPHKVCSARILRDKSGMGRGVGFARYAQLRGCSWLSSWST